MSAGKFKNAQHDIKEDPTTVSQTRIVSQNGPATTKRHRNSEVRVSTLNFGTDSPVVTEYNLQALGRTSGAAKYEKVRDKFGGFAVTDPAAAGRARKDSRFSINPLVRDGLGVNEEEQRVIESRVNDQVRVLTEQARQSGMKAGYEEGLRKGRDEAARTFRVDAEKRLAGLDSLIAEFENARQKIFQANEHFLIELVYRISRMVMLRELKDDREYVTRLARGILERMGVKENIKIRVSARDLETAGLVREGLERELGTLKNLTIEASAQVTSGGCQVETEWNAIDATIDTQLQGVRDALGAGGAT